jgi:hypothetical protein
MVVFYGTKALSLRNSDLYHGTYITIVWWDLCLTGTKLHGDGNLEKLGHWKHFSGSLGRGETFKGSRFLLDGYGDPKYPPFLPQTIPFFGDWLRPEVPPIVWGKSKSMCLANQNTTLAHNSVKEYVTSPFLLVNQSNISPVRIYNPGIVSG